MRGIPGVLTRRRVTTGVIVLGTGALASVTLAAGPVVYSEYTTGGDGERGSRLVQGDGSGDVALPVDLSGAAVSPDGRRIAQTTLTSSPRSEGISSSLRVTAGDGSGATTLLDERPGRDGGAPDRVITGTPVWSPDSTRVIVQRTTLDEGDPSQATRLVCVVDTKACTEAGRANALDGQRASLRGDVVAWQASDGPLVRDAARGGALSTRIRCGAGARTVKGPSVRITGLPGSSFGGPVALRGLGGPDDGETVISPDAIGALAIPAGTLLVDAPGATIRRGALRCSDRSGRFSLRSSLGVARVRLRAGGRTTTLPTPPGLRRGDGLRLVGTDDGGAILLSRPSPSRSDTGYCYRRTTARVRECSADLDPEYTDGRPTVLRVWRLLPGPAPRFERVTTARRSALRTLAAAKEFTVADGNAVLAVSEDAIERVPLDGGPPTTIARGRELSLDVSVW